MGVKGYFEFKGVKYGIGTIVKVPYTKDLRWIPKEKIIVETKFIGGGQFQVIPHGYLVTLYESAGHFSGKYEEYIEIITPVYYQEPAPPKPPNIFFRTGSGTWDAYNDVCIGFIWYIVAIFITFLFKNRIELWVLETIIYFSWKAKK